MPHAELPTPSIWLDLAEAADFLGVHFTTLRRWADAGAVPHMRTPGGRRRFALSDLQSFLGAIRQTPARAGLAPLEARAIALVRRSGTPDGRQPGPWLQRLTADQRLQFKQAGQRFLNLLVKYSSAADNAERHLRDGVGVAAGYGQICRQAGFSVGETVEAFLFFRRAYLEAIYDAGGLIGAADPEGRRLGQRSTDFLDATLVAVVESYAHS